MSEYQLPDKIINLWCWPPDMVMKIRNRWIRAALILPAFLMMIILLSIFGIFLILSLLGEPIVHAWNGD